jgi:hypothetical protein
MTSKRLIIHYMTEPPTTSWVDNIRQNKREQKKRIEKYVCFFVR